MASLGVAGVAVLAVATACLSAGCSSIGYYAHSVGGHLDLLRSARPVPQWLDDHEAAAGLKERLALTQRIRDFAVSELKLPDNASYRRYADLKRTAAVWNVVAAPELSLTLKTWCFPVVGCVGYRGYFDRERADTFADELRAQGLEVSVYGVPAYSTLGAIPGDFFADPLLNTFLQFPEGELARLIFHELAHQVAYAKGDTEFNESFATAVERIGGSRHDFRGLTMKYRDRFEALYASDASDERKRALKAQLMDELRAEYARIKSERWAGFSGYDAWFSRANNASLGVLAAYNELVPGFERLFQRSGRDFPRFYAEVKRLAGLPTKAERRAALASKGD
jgi:predicted aminopeptidase